jgi:DNA-binding CsgD family transcriptional regulator
MNQISDPATTLTPRQLELLALYASGYDYTEIGAMKFLSPHSVRGTLKRAMGNVGARNLTHLCTLSIEAGVIRKNGVGFKPVQDETVVGE